MIKQKLEEWRIEASRRFGEQGRYWKFKCPQCGHVQCAQDFIDRGVSEDDAKSAAYQRCMGRYFDDVGCDWCSYGLFGTLEEGRIVITPEGKEVEIFDFADAALVVG